MAKKFAIRTVLPVSPKEIYEAWLDGEKHGLMTGGAAEADSSVGSSFSAWDGYISGKNLELIPNEKIVQSWRTTNFGAGDPDSHLELQLKPVSGGCEIRLLHSNIPNDSPDYKKGWEEHYFTPMQQYFQK